MGKIVLLAIAALLYALGPVSARSVDDAVAAMERDIAQLREQQADLKREAVAAAAKLPDFSYRPGGGLTIEAADKAWSINFGFEAHMRMLVKSKHGPQIVPEANGTIFARRYRFTTNYCVNNCFYEINLAYDNNGVDSLKRLDRGQMRVHLEQLNPWLPTVAFGMEGEMPVSVYRQGSRSTGAQGEYDMLSRGSGVDDGNYSKGVTLNWYDLNFSSGTGQLNLGVGKFALRGEGVSANTDRKDFALYGRIEPFTKFKNKWIEGLGVEYAGWFCNQGRLPAFDLLLGVPANAASTFELGGCGRLQIRNPGNRWIETLFDFNPSGGTTTARYHLVGLGWKVGPYQSRAIRGFLNFDFKNSSSSPVHGLDASARNFLIAHDLFLWSPKGWFSGDANVPGSILFGTHFERADYSCGRSNCAVGAQFSRNRILFREWDLWYFLPNRISIGGSLLWYDASNLRTGRGQAGQNLGALPARICDAAGSQALCRGKGGDLVDFNLNFRVSF